MQVLEVDIFGKEINFNSLLEKINPGLHRTLLRFTGRSLTTNEFESFKTHFNWKLYPLLDYRPNILNTTLNPLYINSIPFEFPIISRTLKI
ncbi:MAG: hypothetical protein ACFFDW_06110 [Candidatus Thorarchaeota archaeon]